MKEIISKDNKLIKEWAKLKQKKFVDKTDCVLLEGITLINEAEQRNVKFEAVCTNFQTDEDFGCPTYFLKENAFKVLSGTENSQGIIAVAKMPKNKFSLPKGNFLVLDQIKDPGNLGTIIRTAVACGFCEIYCLNCVSFRNEKVIRSTMGTIFDCKIMDITLDEFNSLSKYLLYSAEMSGKSVFEIKSTPKQFGIVVGNEAHGISEEVKKTKLEAVSLPMKNKVESLNAGVACGILMYILLSKQKQ
ncbi:MAG: RNA methyltransferase [Clostridia bacterium]|nr:RNA methyltransferase [Clostridia bacterium]